MKSKQVSQLLIKVNGKVSSYTAFNDGIESFLRSTGSKTDLYKLDVESLIKSLLTAGPKNIIVDKFQRVISQFLS